MFPLADNVRSRTAPWINPLTWRLPAIETYPAVVAFAQTLAGKLVLFALFAGLMKLVSPGMWIADRSMWAWMVVGAALVSLAGPHRRPALLICTRACTMTSLSRKVMSELCA